MKKSRLGNCGLSNWQVLCFWTWVHHPRLRPRRLAQNIVTASKSDQLCPANLKFETIVLCKHQYHTFFPLNYIRARSYSLYIMYTPSKRKEKSSFQAQQVNRSTEHSLEGLHSTMRALKMLRKRIFPTTRITQGRTAIAQNAKWYVRRDP